MQPVSSARQDTRRGQVRGGRFKPSGGNPDGGGCSGIIRDTMASGELNSTSGVCGRARDGTPHRIIIMQAAPQAGSSGQSPSQQGSDTAAISAARPADASKAVAPNRVTTNSRARNDLKIAAIRPEWHSSDDPATHVRLIFQLRSGCTSQLAGRQMTIRFLWEPGG